MAEKQQLADDIPAGVDEVNLTELSDEALGEIFGIDLDTEDDTFAAPKVPKKKAAKPRLSTRPEGKSSPKQLGASAGARPKKVATQGPGARASKESASPSRARLSVTSGATTRGTRAAASGPSRLRITGARILRLRRKHNLSVAEFARQLGVSTSTVYRWELTSGKLSLQKRVREALQALRK